MQGIMENGVAIAVVLMPWIKVLVDVIKPFIKDTKWYPILSMLIGVVFGIVVSLLFGFSVPEYVLAGFIAGVGASGLYDIAKSVKNSQQIEGEK